MHSILSYITFSQQLLCKSQQIGENKLLSVKTLKVCILQLNIIWEEIIENTPVLYNWGKYVVISFTENTMTLKYNLDSAHS